MESKTPIERIISRLEEDETIRFIDQAVGVSKEIKDKYESTLIAEHKLMKDALQKIESEAYGRNAHAPNTMIIHGIASETLKKLGR